MADLLPCATCPWRIDKGAGTIPRYNHKKACGLIDTVGDGDGFRPIMACHHSTEGAEFACNGYLAREGWSNINVRLLAAKGTVHNPDAVLTACKAAGVRLHKSYPAVLRKLKRTTAREGRRG